MLHPPLLQLDLANCRPVHQAVLHTPAQEGRLKGPRLAPQEPGIDTHTGALEPVQSKEWMEAVLVECRSWTSQPRWSRTLRSVSVISRS